MITQEQYDRAVAAKGEAENTIHQFHQEKVAAEDQRIKSGKPFTDDELTYSADSLCPCGHGLAYPKNPGTLMMYWDCSAILKGIAEKSVQHTDRLPFALYDVKSEGQPSAGGRTTRGVFKPKAQ